MCKFLGIVVLLAFASAAGAQSKLPPEARRTFADPITYAPVLLERASASELRDAVARYTADRQLLLRFHNVQGSLARIAAQERFADGWMQALAALDFDRLSQDGKVDYLLLANRVRSDRQQATAEAR